MRAAAGIALIAIGMLMCIFDLGRRVARRHEHGGLVQAIWGPSYGPVLFYLGFGLLVVGSLLVFGTANP